MGELVTGQMRETVGPRVDEDPVKHYLSVIGQKTGSLIATAGRYGGMFSGGTPAQVEALYRYGEIIGAAFQISDDIIDIASPTEESGKTPGTDLREGVRTLPMYYALAEDTGQDAGPGSARLRELLAGPVASDDEVAEALELLRVSDGLRRARETLDSYMISARVELAALPPGPARDALDLLARYVVDRTG
jgi:heptaprenyl diphosphate synthase